MSDPERAASQETSREQRPATPAPARSPRMSSLVRRYGPAILITFGGWASGS